MVAKEPIAQGAPILALPLSKCWTADTARACSQLASYLDVDAPDSTWLALHLLLVKQRPLENLHKQLELLDESVAGAEIAQRAGQNPSLKMYVVQNISVSTNKIHEDLKHNPKNPKLVMEDAGKNAGVVGQPEIRQVCSVGMSKSWAFCKGAHGCRWHNRAARKSKRSTRSCLLAARTQKNSANENDTNRYKQYQTDTGCIFLLHEKYRPRYAKIKLRPDTNEARTSLKSIDPSTGWPP